jgi:hypothetical protein
VFKLIFIFMSIRTFMFMVIFVWTLMPFFILAWTLTRAFFFSCSLSSIPLIQTHLHTLFSLLSHSPASPPAFNESSTTWLPNFWQKPYLTAPLVTQTGSDHRAIGKGSHVSRSLVIIRRLF